MGQVKFTIANEVKYQKLLEANCRHHGYKDMILDDNGVEIPNPETKQQFMDRTAERIFREAGKAQLFQEAVNQIVIEE